MLPVGWSELRRAPEPAFEHWPSASVAKAVAAAFSLAAQGDASIADACRAR
jgi:hypothetical protein